MIDVPLPREGDAHPYKRETPPPEVIPTPYEEEVPRPPVERIPSAIEQTRAMITGTFARRTVWDVISEIAYRFADAFRGLIASAIEERIFTDKEIRDTSTYNSLIVECKNYDIVTFWIDNKLNQTVATQIKGNRVKGPGGAVDIGAAFNCAATDTESRTIEPIDEGFLPYIFASVSCATAPTSGKLNVYAIKKPL